MTKRKVHTSPREPNRVYKLVDHAKKRGIILTYDQAREWHMKYQSQAYTKFDELLEIAQGENQHRKYHSTK